MKENIFELSELNLYNDNDIKNKSSIYTLIFILILISMTILLLLMKKNLYYENDLYISDINKTTYILKQDYDYIKNNNYITINNRNYFYKIKEIELINDTTIYYKVYLDIDLDIPKGSIQNYKILVKKESILNYIIRIMKGE